ncbi:MAG: hypothetical protein KGK07_03675 [Chloroflexota bacterium]|nr:hypothetical protein [Chloroflexota bacterium]
MPGTHSEPELEAAAVEVLRALQNASAGQDAHAHAAARERACVAFALDRFREQRVAAVAGEARELARLTPTAAILERHIQRARATLTALAVQRATPDGSAVRRPRPGRSPQPDPPPAAPLPDDAGLAAA